MSTARPMGNDHRLAVYLRGRSAPTPAQSRRLRRKHYRALR
jgi:hypothetical protein